MTFTPPPDEPRPDEPSFPGPDYAWAPVPGPVYPAAPAPGPPVWLPPSALPVEERAYHAFYRTPRWRWWRPLAAFGLAGLVWLIASAVFSLIGLVLDGVDLLEVAETGELELGPWLFLSNNVAVASALLIAPLTQWLVFGQRPRWLSSVVGGVRWRWLFRCVLVALPIWLVLAGVEYQLGGWPTDIGWRPYSVVMIVGILLTTPLQAAGEEYLIRGLEQRLVASYVKPEVLGWVIATVITSLTFVALHAAADPWLNLFYFCFGAICSWLVWRTGGLEAAVALHLVNNLVAEALLPVTDFSDLFDRSAGAGNPLVLVHVAVLVGVAVVLDRLARRENLVVRTAPGAEKPYLLTEPATRGRTFP